MNLPVVVAITGASGAVYAVRLLEVLARANREVHLTISPAGQEVLRHERQIEVDLRSFRLESLVGQLTKPAPLVYHHFQDLGAPIASGSFLTAGMVVCPCSGGTLASLAVGTATNLIHRAAEVHLKERRKLVLVPRETPLSLIHIENLKRVTEAGAVALPAAPGWYHGVESVMDLVDFVVARILDQLQVPHQLMRRWGSPAPPPGVPEAGS
ncbi:MAG: UbiX family flavin prenyltransferase [Pirellulaceae bacterium]